LAAVNNWALDLCDRHEFERANDLLRHGLRVAPDHRPFQVNLVVVQQCERDREKEMQKGTLINTNWTAPLQRCFSL